MVARVALASDDKRATVATHVSGLQFRPDSTHTVAQFGHESLQASQGASDILEDHKDLEEKESNIVITHVV